MDLLKKNQDTCIASNTSNFTDGFIGGGGGGGGNISSLVLAELLSNLASLLWGALFSGVDGFSQNNPHGNLKINLSMVYSNLMLNHFCSVVFCGQDRALGSM